MLIQQYTSQWPKNFDLLRKEIEGGLSGLTFQIEHIGSTSIPNLDSKPIIDIDIIYYNRSEFEKIKSGLIKLGYNYNGDQGIKEREVFKRARKSSQGILDLIPHHLYVCPAHSKSLERHILTRNFLRRNEWAKIRYQDLKYELAEKAAQDKKVYAALKEIYINEFIDDIIESEKKNTT